MVDTPVDFTWTGATDNSFDPLNATVVSLGDDGVFGGNHTINGITGGVDGRVLIIYNADPVFNLTLNHENGSASAGDRTHQIDSISVVLAPNENLQLRYGGSRWRADFTFQGALGGAASIDVSSGFTVASDPVLEAGNNLSDVGSVQNSIDTLTAVSGATNEEVLTKDTGSGNAIFKAVPASSTLINADHELTPAASSGSDNFDTTLAITSTPVGMVEVLINGVIYVLGDGVKTKDFYFTDDGGVSAQAISAIVATDELYFNAVIVSFNLSTADRIDIIYET